MKAQPLVSIIVVTLNNINLLRNCLKSLYAQNYKPIEIIVVDNGSKEDIKNILANEFPEVIVVRLDKNYGFADGNNRGIKVAKGEYIALINNDATASPQWISSLVTTAESETNIGAVASIVVDGNQPELIDSVGVGITLDGMSRQAMRGKPIPTITKPKEVLLFSGCACLLKKETIKDVGYFDSDFFAYCEDTDLGLRLRWAGWKIVVAPDSYVNHYYSMTGGKFSLEKVYLVERNHFWVALKNFPWFLLFILPVFTIWRFIAQTFFVLRGKSELNKFIEKHNIFTLIKIYLKAYINMFLRLPLMLKKRWCSRKNRQISNIDMFRLIWKQRLSMSELFGY